MFLRQYIFFVFAFLSFFIFAKDVCSQQITEGELESFVEALIAGSESIVDYVDRDEMLESQRLGITYRKAKHKFLIGKSIPDSLRILLQNGDKELNLNVSRLDNIYTLLELSSPGSGFSQKYYFKNKGLISSEKYFSRNWTVIESKYFIFHVSEANLTNTYAVDLMDKTFLSFAAALDMVENPLSGSKINYFLCRDEEEIENLTGYRSRGMCNLAYDYIVSTYNSHYHELVHLLINLKLKEAPLYVHPLIQEGLAVYLGGRGGVASKVLIDAGVFMLKNNFMVIDDFYSTNSFAREDASVSYSAAGLYTFYLLSKLETDEYIKLYKDYGFDDPQSENDRVFVPLFSKDDFETFLEKYTSNKSPGISVNPEAEFNPAGIIFDEQDIKISYNNNTFYILSNTDFLIKDTAVHGAYISNKFKEFYPRAVYGGEHYLVRVNRNEISIYDLLTNTLIEQFTPGFDLQRREVKESKGMYSFSVSNNIFSSCGINKTFIIPGIKKIK